MTPANDATLAAALASLPADAVVVVDFDDTLLRGNSTRLYLRTLRPRLLATALLSLVDLVQPWRLLPGPDPRRLYRDWLRVVLLTVLLPWSPLLWRRRAPALAHANAGLVAALAAAPHARVVVASYGFRFLVAPMLRALPAPAASWPLPVAAPFLRGFRLRHTGKAHAVRQHLGADTLARSLVVTDSEDDCDFVPLSRTVLFVPPAAAADSPDTSYLPLRYMHRCKREGENTVLRVILFYDLVTLLLAYAPASLRPFSTAAGLLCFQLAFWTVYEIGNWENDVLGARWEARPHLPARFAAWRDRVRPGQAWLWAAALAVPAAFLLGHGLDGDVFGGGPIGRSAHPVLASYAFLLACLGVGRLFYAVYNRTDPGTRVFLYPLMQLSKAAGLALVLPAAPAGLLLVLSVVLVRQLRYVVYRTGETRRAFAIPANLHTLLCYALLCAVSLCLTGPEDRRFWIVAGLVVLWHGQRARREIAAVLRATAWLPSQARRVEARRLRADAGAPP